LLFRAMHHERGAYDHQPERVGHRRCLGACQLLLEHSLLEERGPTPTIGLGPVNASPAGIEHLLLPGPHVLKRPLRVTRHGLLRDIGCEPGANLLSKRLGGGVKTYIHTRLLTYWAGSHTLLSLRGLWSDSLHQLAGQVTWCAVTPARAARS